MRSLLHNLLSSISAVSNLIKRFACDYNTLTLLALRIRRVKPTLIICSRAEAWQQGRDRGGFGLQLKAKNVNSKFTPLVAVAAMATKYLA